MAVVLLSTTAPAVHDVRAQSNEELMAIIRQQQRQIDELSRKVDALTRQTETATEKADEAGEQAATAAQTAQKVEETAPDIQVKWAPSPTFSSNDGTWSAHVFGRLQVDW
jgi:septal ring factor EnvC (AmiA/AmiB activator)